MGKKIIFVFLLILNILSYGKDYNDASHAASKVELNSKDIMDSNKNSAEFRFEFSLDCIKVPDILFHANANFTIGFTAKLDKDFHPVSIDILPFTQSIIKDIWNKDEIISCIKKWRFKGLNPRSTYTILLRWEHMKGWVTMLIYSDKMNLYINLLQDRN